MELLVIKLPEVEKGFALLPQRWVVERSFGWVARFRRPTRDGERLPETLATSHYLAFAMVMLRNFVSLMAQSYKFITRSRDKCPCNFLFLRNFSIGPIDVLAHLGSLVLRSK